MNFDCTMFVTVIYARFIQLKIKDFYNQKFSFLTKNSTTSESIISDELKPVNEWRETGS